MSSQTAVLVLIILSQPVPPVMSVSALNQPRFASLALPPYQNVTYAVLVLFALHVLPNIQLTQQKNVSFALN